MPIEAVLDEEVLTKKAQKEYTQLIFFGSKIWHRKNVMRKTLEGVFLDVFNLWGSESELGFPPRKSSLHCMMALICEVKILKLKKYLFLTSFKLKNIKEICTISFSYL